MIEDKNNNKAKDNSPEHVPVVSYNAALEKEKEERRKLANSLKKKSGKHIPIITTKEGLTKDANSLTIKEQEDEFIKCATNPIHFIETYLSIFDQTQGESGKIVPFILFDFQKDLITDYEKHRFNVANKYRQAGISTCTCAYIAWYVMFKSDRSVAIIADKLETARDELMNDVVDFIDACPAWLKPKPEKKDTQKLKRYDNGTELAAFSSKGLRGYTPTLLFWDETAWTEKNDKFWESAGPTLQTGGRAVFVSCVTEDSFIYTNKGIKQIKDFIPNNELGAHSIDDIHLLGTHKKRKSNIFFNNGYVETLKINTTYSELESSENHKYWTYKNNEYNWVKASDLEVGDYVSIQKGMNVWGDNDDCSDFNPTKTNKIKNKFKPTKITQEIAYFIGLYISEGYIRRCENKNGGQINISCGDDLSEIYKKLNIPYTCFNKMHYVTNSYNLLEFFEYLGFDITKKAPEKIIPSRLFEMSKKNIIALMQGIMDGDGWGTYNENKNKLRVGIGLSSLELIKQIRVIFNNFGILTEYRKTITPPTKKVKVSSVLYSLVANNFYAKKYFEEIGFNLKRKSIIGNKFKPEEIKHLGVYDNVPNGCEIIKNLYSEIKYYGIHKILKEKNIKINDILYKNKKTSSCSRKTILKFIKQFKNNLSPLTLKKYDYIINDNIIWTKIKSIENSRNWTYDFSISNDCEKECDEQHQSIIYNGMITHNTPSGLDPVFYKTFEGARNKKNNFNAVLLYWFNDPRYNKELVWLKNKNKQNEIKLVDEDWSKERRIQMMDDGWEPSSPWFEEQIMNANGDMRKIAQELLGSFLGSGDNFINEKYIKRIEDEEIAVPIRQEYVDNNMWIFEDPLPGEDYMLIADVSPGYGEDFSTINILKSTEVTEEKVIKKNGKSKKTKITHYKNEQVAEYYGKLSPQVLAELLYQFGKIYNEGYVVIDVTGGHGAQTVEKLIEIGYENIHYSEIIHKPTRDRLSGYIKTAEKKLPDGKVVMVDLVPGFFIGNNRGSILLEMQRAINLGDVLIRSTRLAQELKTFVTVAGNRVADHKRTFHDDSIIGLAIGLYVINFEIKKFKIRKDNSEKMVSGFMTGADIKNKPQKKSPIQKTMDYNNPYDTHSWLFKGMKN